jgi:hypothetical protein
MRRERDYFADRELDLLYIAKRLGEALRLEELLTGRGVDYLVETDRYLGGIIFRSERVGAFFYVLPGALQTTRDLLTENGLRPWVP